MVSRVHRGTRYTWGSFSRRAMDEREEWFKRLSEDARPDFSGINWRKTNIPCRTEFADD